MLGPYIHNLDPVFGQFGSFYLWWYGLSYNLGFAGLFFWILIHGKSMRMNKKERYDLMILVASGVLIGGRMG